MKELTEEQKQLADQMIESIQNEITDGQNIVVGPDGNVPDEVTPVEARPNALVDGILEWGKTLDINNLSENSVLMIKVNVDDPQYAHHFQMGVVRHVLEPRFELLKQKKVTVLFMSDKDDISVISEVDMNKSGWTKKEPNRIITL